jgi:hypothetical protein
MREHGAQVEDYKGSRLVVGDAPEGKPTVSLAFLEPGLVAVGSSVLVRGAVDLKAGGASIATNDAMMNLIRDIDSGNAWAAAASTRSPRRQVCQAASPSNCPPSPTFQPSPPSTAASGPPFAPSPGRTIGQQPPRPRPRLPALAKLQSSARPENRHPGGVAPAGRNGTTVSLSFDLPATALDALSALGHRQAAAVTTAAILLPAGRHNRLTPAPPGGLAVAQSPFGPPCILFGKRIRYARRNFVRIVRSAFDGSK